MKKGQFDNLPYTLRFRIALGVVLVGIIALFRFAPDFNIKRGLNNMYEVPADNIIDLIEITTQASPPSSPPRPQVRAQATEEVIIDDIDLDRLLDFEAEFNRLPLPTIGSGSGNIVRSPQRPPRVQRIVEPISPTSTNLLQIRAEITALLTIDASGNVEDVEITDIKIFNRNSRRFETAGDIHPFFIESTIAAALQWQFRAASHEGNPVKSQSTHVFTFGSGIN